LYRNSFTVDVTVNPAPVGSATHQTICSGSTTNVALNSTVIGTTFTWIAAIQTAPTAAITGFSNGSKNAKCSSHTGTTVGIIHTVTPTANLYRNSFTVDVTVNPIQPLYYHRFQGQTIQQIVLILYLILVTLLEAELMLPLQLVHTAGSYLVRTILVLEFYNQWKSTVGTLVIR
jgi:hypothetical protein